MALLTIILLTVHLLAMNVASAGPLVCVWLHCRGRRGDETAFAVGRQLAWLSLAVLVAGMALGLVMLAIFWSGVDRAYVDAIGRFPASAVFSAVGEAAFSVVVLAIYAGTWHRLRDWPWLHGLLAVLAATNLLYHFPPLMAALGTLAVRPELVPDLVITRSVILPLMMQPEALSQSLHFGIASLAVTGLAVMVMAGRLRRKIGAADQQSASRLVRAGAAITLATSLVQLVVGVWVLVELPVRVRNGLIGDDWLATGLFLVAIIATFGLLHTLALVSLGDTSDRSVWRCGALMLGVVALMSGVLEIARNLEVENRRVEERAVDSGQLIVDSN